MVYVVLKDIFDKGVIINPSNIIYVQELSGGKVDVFFVGGCDKVLDIDIISLRELLSQCGIIL